MERLIDGNKTIELLREAVQNGLPQKAMENGLAKYAIRTLIDTMEGVIDAQPTAFSREKAVDELMKEKMRYYWKYANTGNEENDRIYEEVVNAINKAIEILGFNDPILKY